ncbi:metallophosphoesterase [Marinilactibacillus kalidii]|uniref:metallophosphoesterase n=1 Tax=Marinilactibacillus kalidii TaxID=2820274 RepID=UPI001ABEE63B|nr:metallophosphoesterase [Marinilactibacillus kalidii]
MNWLKKHTIFSSLLVFILLLIGWITWDNKHIETTVYNIEDTKIPASLNGFTIAQVSDLHNKDWGDQLIDRLTEAKPDLIVVTGDLIDSRKTDLPTAITFINEASTIAPIYYVTGNHEARIAEYEELIESTSDSVILLDNQQTVLEAGNDDVRLIGLQDPSFPTADTETHLQHLTDDYDGYTLLLSHRPELFETYERYHIDLVLSGHAHGGQFRLPFIGGLVAPNQGFFPTYSAGLYAEGETTMIVSRGLGNSLFPFRVNNPPELVIINLFKEAFPNQE